MPEKPTLKPPSQPPVFPTDPHASRAKRRALIALAVLAVVAAAVALILPYWVSTPRQSTSLPREIEPVRTSPPPPAQPSAKETKARDLLGKALELKARLDNEGAKTWGQEQLETSYGLAHELLAEADSQLDARRFDLATDGYQKTIDAFKKLESSRPDRLKMALKAGNEALELPDAEAARRCFEIALAADAGSDEARTGLQRAEVLPQVADLIEKGRQHEENGVLDNAREMYAQALKLDQHSKTAQKHLQHVEGLIAERDFQRALSDAMSAFNRRDIKTARTNLNTAKKIHPDNASVRDLEQQIAAAERSAALQRLSNQATRHEKDEQWEQALELYNRALNVDAAAGFAQRGKVRAERFVTLNRAVTKYLENPGELQAPEHRAHARSICKTATAAGDTGPKLKARIGLLRALIERYDRPVSILLQSDAMTDVMLYRVGRFGTFREHSLQLTPGRYKAHGSRSGYRDVTIEFTVPVDGANVTVRVVCEEKL